MRVKPDGVHKTALSIQTHTCAEAHGTKQEVETENANEKVPKH